MMNAIHILIMVFVLWCDGAGYLIAARATDDSGYSIPVGCRTCQRSIHSDDNSTTQAPISREVPMQHNSNQFPPLEEIIRAEKFGAFDDRPGQSVLRLYRLGLLDNFSRGIICERIRKLANQLAAGTLAPFQRARLTTGNFSPGATADGRQFYIPPKYLCGGVGFFGGTWSGKSTTFFHWVPQVVNDQCAAWIIEPYKKDWRQMLPVLQRYGRELIIIRAQDCKLNPLQAGKADPRTHLSTVVNVLDRVLDVPGRARSILRHACHELYTRFGIWTGNTKAWPCLFDLYEWIYSARGLNSPARDALLDRLVPTLNSGQCLAHRVGWDPVALQRWSIVFELADAGEQLKQLLIEPCLYSIFQSAYQSGASNADLSLWIVIDDALRFLHTGQNAGSEITPLDELVAVVRGSGKGLAVLCPTTHGVSRPLMANLTFKVMGHLNLSEDYQVLGANMIMAQEQITWAEHRLRPKTYVGQLGIGEWQEPFVFHVPDVSISRGVDDLTAASTLKALNGLPTVPAAEFVHWQPHHVIAVSTGADTTRERFSEVELRFLGEVIKAPGKASSYYAREAHLNGAAAVAVRTRLVTLKYLREHLVATGQRGRTSIVLEPLDKAFTAISERTEEDQT